MFSIFKQPTSFYTVTCAYMCERFGYFMLRTILVLYMIQLLLLPAEEAYSTFAAFSALMFLSPLIGGKYIDRNFDDHHAAVYGGFLLSLGLFCLAYFNAYYLNLALSLIICGKGFYAPGIIGSIGKMYHQGDNRRESGFTLMYSAINLSAIIPTLSAPIIIFYYGWKFAFLTAGSVTLLGAIMLYYHNSQKSDYRPLTSAELFEFCIFIGAGIFVFTLLLWSTVMSNVFMIALSSLLFIYTLMTLATMDEIKRKQTIICFALTAFTIIFFTLSQQSAMSLTVFAENNVDRAYGNFIIPTFYFLALNPIFILILTPFMQFIRMSTPYKFAAGTILAGIGFIVLVFAMTCMQTSAGKINFSWLVLSYFLQTLGELLIFPVGLAMITDLAPRQMIGFMIGTWYFMMAIANMLAGIASKFTIQVPYLSTYKLTGPFAAYAQVYGTLGMIAVFAGLGLFSACSVFYPRKFLASHSSPSKS